LTCTLLTLLVDAAHFLWLCLHAPTALAAANLVLRKQLALYQERQIKLQRATDTTRLALVWLGRWCAWRQAFAIGQPETLPVPLQAHRHQLPEHLPVVSQPILGGLHHAYALAEKVA
jgi:hypothetical protein